MCYCAWFLPLHKERDLPLSKITQYSHRYLCRNHLPSPRDPVRIKCSTSKMVAFKKLQYISSLIFKESKLV